MQGTLHCILEISMVSHPVAVAADVDDVAVMDQPVYERCSHDVVAKDLAPLLEAFIRREYCGSALVPPAHELEEEHGTGPGDGQVSNLVYDQSAGETERFQTVQLLSMSRRSRSSPHAPG